jgi:hypothetical protein
MRIWYLSPRKVRDTRSSQFPTGTGRATIEIVVESGMLYLAVQLVFVVLFAIRHPAQGIVGVIAVQIYVRVPFTLKGDCCKNQITPSPQGIAPTLILVRVALGLSNMQPGPIGSGAALPVSQPTQVRIGYSTVAFTDAGWRLPAETPKSKIKSKRSSGDRGSSLSSVKDASTV